MILVDTISFKVMNKNPVKNKGKNIMRQMYANFSIYKTLLFQYHIIRQQKTHQNTHTKDTTMI